MIKKIINIIYVVLIILLCAFALVVIVANVDTPLKMRLFAVQSGSMEPALHTGSVVISKQFMVYKVGDIITYQNIKNSKTTITHRVFKIENTKQGAVYFSKGDANNVDDKTPILQSQILGKVIATIPFVGFIVEFSKTLIGFLTLIIIPATLIIFSELTNIKNEIVSIIKKRK